MRLPIFQDLSREQIEIFGLPLNGNWLVTGPPGTGKSVMALYRAKMLEDQNRPVTTLVWNKLLRQYVESAEKELGLSKDTLHSFDSWFWQYWIRNFGGRPPLINVDDGFKPIDWAKVHQTLNSEGIPALAPDLIIDEGQDLDEGFYIFCQLLCDHVTVFADENQTLNPGKASTEEIKNSIGVEGTFELRRNYRNTRAIAEFASYFYDGLPAAIPDLPDATPGERPVGPPVPYDEWEESADQIVRWVKDNPEQEIGVFLPRKANVDAFYKYLEAELASTPRVTVQRYRGGVTKAVVFGAPGPIVTTYASSKGLEFDTVFVCELNQYSLPADDPLTRNQFYVMASRARTRLDFHYSDKRQSVPRVVTELFPQGGHG